MKRLCIKTAFTVRTPAIRRPATFLFTSGDKNALNLVASERRYLVLTADFMELDEPGLADKK